MTSIFGDLFLYEKILLGIGILLFFILITMLIYFISKNKKLTGLLIFLPVSIIMIVYPSVQGIEIAKDRLTISKNTHLLVENPKDSTAQDQIIKAIENLENRSKTSEDYVIVSKSNFILGNNEKATTYNNKALNQDPGNKNAKDLAKLIQYGNAMQVKNHSVTTEEIENMNVSPELRPIKTFIKKQKSKENANLPTN